MIAEYGKGKGVKQKADEIDIIKAVRIYTTSLNNQLNRKQKQHLFLP